MRVSLPFAFGVLAALGSGTMAQSQPPMSAIDWLSQQAAQPSFLAPGEILPETQLREAPVTQTAALPKVSTLPLGEGPATVTGLLPVDITGLADTIWSASTTGALAQALADVPVALPHGARELMYRLLLAKAQSPQGEQGHSLWVATRVDRLLALGAANQAYALLETADPQSRALFQRWFDTATLLRREAEPCAALRTDRSLSKDPATQVFCLARANDWTSAALTLQTGKALGDLDADAAALLGAFLEPDFAETMQFPALGRDITPLEFRLREAVGASATTYGLPLKFAVVDLEDTAGWKAQLEAAERLARTGALSANQFLGLATERAPSASGGVWDRIAPIQRLDTALREGDLSSVETALPQAWKAAKQGGYGPLLADIFGPNLAGFTFVGDAQMAAIAIGYLSVGYESFAKRQGGESDPEDLRALAFGESFSAGTGDALRMAVLRAFEPDPTLPPARQAKLEAGQLGEVILATLGDIGQGHQGDLDALSRGLSSLRALGLEDIARRTALGLLILR